LALGDKNEVAHCSLSKNHSLVHTAQFRKNVALHGVSGLAMKKWQTDERKGTGFPSQHLLSLKLIFIRSFILTVNNNKAHFWAIVWGHIGLNSCIFRHILHSAGTCFFFQRQITGYSS
jgi:hypothetical protein